MSLFFIVFKSRSQESEYRIQNERPSTVFLFF
jgi:hypothetical protein